MRSQTAEAVGEGACAVTFTSKAVGLWLAVLATLSAGAAHAAGDTLAARDLNHDGVVDAYYDSRTQLTWLADANYIQTTGWEGPEPIPDNPRQGANGELDWQLASQWAAGLDVFGVTGWRLPTLTYQSVCETMPGATHAVCTRTVDGGSEFGQLVHGTLGNGAGSFTDTGPFRNVQPGGYWSNVMVSDLPGLSAPVWYYASSSDSYDYASQMWDLHHAWAVRPGDVAIGHAPEPGSWLLAGIGCMLLALVGRRSSHA